MPRNQEIRPSRSRHRTGQHQKRRQEIRFHGAGADQRAEGCPFLRFADEKPLRQRTDGRFRHLSGRRHRTEKPRNQIRPGAKNAGDGTTAIFQMMG